MVRADFECFFEVLRDTILDVWDVSTILESGDEAVTVDPDVKPYPWGIIELGEEVTSVRGPAAKDITWEFPIYLWLLMEKTEGATDLETFRELLSDMVTRLYKDSHLRGTVNNLIPGPMNWSGRGREWPVAPMQGESAMAGYVSFRFQLIESLVV